MERPVIGLSCGRREDQSQAFLHVAYLEAVAAAGGLPVVLPPLEPGGLDLAQVAAALLARVDGLLLTGGDDLDPRHYGQEPDPRLGWVDPDRDALELALAQEALRRRTPLLAICRGVQVLNVAAGGDLHQDLGEVARLQHSQRAPRWHRSHPVRVHPGSRLAQLLDTPGGEVAVNSFHHQAVRQVAPGFRAVAHASDGVVEAIERAGEDHFCVGVQWHPEHLVGRWPEQRGLFRGLVEAARVAAAPHRGERGIIP